jgi:CelD/BcsL family acetyltransferase involved in cellulose biosynthesis
VIAGNGFADFDPPRAEYNDLESLIRLTGGMEALIMELAKHSWNQFVLTDFGNDYGVEVILNNVTNSRDFHIAKFRSEMAYRISPINFDVYKKQLGSSTRAKYFNRRDRLANYGTLELTELNSSQEFFEVLNHFHQLRWGRPCYSSQSMVFFSLFGERIRHEGGDLIMQALRVNGEIISVLFDIVWRGIRYNLQSGYIEGRYGQLALGSLHLGFAIEQALSTGQGYDFLAGIGRHSNYKEKISTEIIAMDTYCVAQGWLKHLYRIHGR